MRFAEDVSDHRVSSRRIVWPESTPASRPLKRDRRSPNQMRAIASGPTAEGEMGARGMRRPGHLVRPIARRGGRLPGGRERVRVWAPPRLSRFAKELVMPAPSSRLSGGARTRFSAASRVAACAPALRVAPQRSRRAQAARAPSCPSGTRPRSSGATRLTSSDPCRLSSTFGAEPTARSFVDPTATGRGAMARGRVDEDRPDRDAYEALASARRTRERRARHRLVAASPSKLVNPAAA